MISKQAFMQLIGQRYAGWPVVEGDIEQALKQYHTIVVIVDDLLALERIKLHLVEEERYYQLVVVMIASEIKNLTVEASLMALDAGLEVLLYCYANNQAQFSINVHVMHQVGSTKSRIQYKGILDDEAVVSIDVLTHIAPHAAGSQVEQRLGAIVLQEGPRVVAIPNLEVLCHEVLASHGCSVGRIDEALELWLCIKGFSKAEAETILIQSFLLR